MASCRRQQRWDRSGDLSYREFLVYRNPKEVEDQPVILRPTCPCASLKVGATYFSVDAQGPYRWSESASSGKRAYNTS